MLLWYVVKKLHFFLSYFFVYSLTSLAIQRDLVRQLSDHVANGRSLSVVFGVGTLKAKGRRVSERPHEIMNEVLPL